MGLPVLKSPTKPFNARDYQTSLSSRYNATSDVAERARIKAEMNRVAGKTGIGVGISGGMASVGMGATVAAPSAAPSATPNPSFPTLQGLSSRIESKPPPTFQPWKPTEFQKPAFSFSSDDQLRDKANTQLSPAFQAALNRIRESNSQRVRSAGESMITGGMSDTGYSKAALAQENALSDRNVADLDLQQTAQLLSMIDQLKQRELQQADKEYDRNYQLWDAQNRMGLNAVNSANDAAGRSWDAEREGIGLLSGLEGTIYQRGRDKITDQREASKFENQPGYNKLLERKTLADIAKAERDARQPYSSGSKSSGGSGGLTPTQARNAGYAQSFDNAAQSLLNYKSFNDMIEDVKRMTPEQKALLGPGGWKELMSYANSGAVRGQYFDKYGVDTTPSGFVPGSSSPLRGALGGSPPTNQAKPATSPSVLKKIPPPRPTAPAKAAIKPVQVKNQAIYNEVLGNIKGASKKNALNYVNDPQVKAELGADYATIVKDINANFK